MSVFWSHITEMFFYIQNQTDCYFFFLKRLDLQVFVTFMLQNSNWNYIKLLMDHVFVNNRLIPKM